MNQIISKSPDETHRLAKDWVFSLDAKDDRALVVGLYGTLGSGKTTFTQAVAKGMGVKDIVNSPTFVIEKIYTTLHPHFTKLIHIDAYRLKNASELQVLNFEELLDDKNNLIIIEWAENVKDILPPDHSKIYFEHVDENSRRIEI